VSSSDGLSSCQIQHEACQSYLDSQRTHGWTLLPERFDDDGYSGASLERPGLNRLLALVRHGGVDQILVHRLDRLSRSVRHCVTLLDEFRRLEVGLVVVTAPELGHSAQDNFMLNIMASLAEFERELIAARIADSRARLKAHRLRFAGGIPFGYDSDRRTKQLVPNEEEAAVVRWMFSEAASGRKPSEIADAANMGGYRTKAPGGGPWSARQVLATLRNPVHVGMLRDGRSVRLGNHPAIVSHELFNAAGNALDERRTRHEKSLRYGPMWPLKGRLNAGLADARCRPTAPATRTRSIATTGAGRRLAVGHPADTKCRRACWRMRLPLTYRTAPEMTSSASGFGNSSGMWCTTPAPAESKCSCDPLSFSRRGVYFASRIAISLSRVSLSL
jgi:DNA invertase Pin-like site-specific DNA recombinase